MPIRAIGEDSFGIAQYQAAKEAMMLLEQSLREGSPRFPRQRTSFHRRGRGGTPGCVAVPGGRIYNAPPPGSMWRERRGAGAVDRGGLENRCTLMGTEGSNPSLSARPIPHRERASKAQAFTGQKVKSRWSARHWRRAGSARRLARLGGSEPGLATSPRQRSTCIVILVAKSVRVDRLRAGNKTLADWLAAPPRTSAGRQELRADTRRQAGSRPDRSRSNDQTSVISVTASAPVTGWPSLSLVRLV